MSRMTSLGKNMNDLYNTDTHKLSYQYKKVINTHKFNGISSNSLPKQNKVIKSNQFQDNFRSVNNYSQKILTEAEKSNFTNNNANSKHNININTSNIINPGSNNDQNILQKFITIRDIIGEKCELNLDIINLPFENFEQSKTSKKNMGSVKSYGVNTYQGIVRNYNEDRVSIIINMNKPKNYTKKWPKISFFGIYDGHGGEGAAEYLRDNLHKLICENEFFPENIQEAIKYGISKAEFDFLNNHALSPNKEEILDKSGSCVIIVLVVDNYIYVANVGDSRCLLSMDNGKKYIAVTQDHKPNSPTELMRIKNNGGNIYQSQTVINNLEYSILNGKILIGPYRVLPGRLSVCRTIGDAEAKIQKFGGNPDVIISTPDIYIYDLKKDDLDFFILGCDGIYDQMSNNEILDLAWMALKNNIEPKENGLNSFNENINNNSKDINDIHYKSGLIVDLILKASLARKSFDNVTCLFIALKDFLPEKPNGIDLTKINDLNNNNINMNNINGKLNPAFSGITTKKIIENINSNGDILNALNEKNQFDKIFPTKKRSNILTKKMIHNFISKENKNKTYRNENRKDSLNNKMINNTRIENSNRIFNTESKLNTTNFYHYKNDQLLGIKSNHEIINDNNNGAEKNTFRKIRKKPHLNKENSDNTIKEKHKLLHNRVPANLMTYSKKNQSLNKNNKYINNKSNTNTSTYKHVRKTNFDLNTYNAYTSKKLSEQNTNRLNNNNNNSLNGNNFHIFKPITKISKLNQPMKLIETKNLINSAKNRGYDNKSSTIINNLTNLNMQNQKYVKTNKEKDNGNTNNNSTYLSFNNNLYNFDNSINTKSKSKYYNKQIINNSNSSILNSYINKNHTLKKPKKYLSLNNTQNLIFNPTNVLPTSNRIMLNRYINNIYTSKMKRDLTSKLRNISKNKSFQENNNNTNNDNISHDNISMHNLHNPNYIYNYADKTQKIRRYNNYKNNLESKSYRNFTYNLNENKNSTKYNNYLVTDLGKAKRQYFFDSKKDLF